MIVIILEILLFLGLVWLGYTLFSKTSSPDEPHMDEPPIRKMESDDR